MVGQCAHQLGAQQLGGGVSELESQRLAARGRMGLNDELRLTCECISCTLSRFGPPPRDSADNQRVTGFSSGTER